MTVIEIPTPDPRTFDETSRPFAEAIAAHYAIKKMIGRGGMGIVYLARDRRLDRLVAIKTLPPELAADRSVRDRFLRETRTAGAMSHPNIVPIHGADEVDGHVFFVMGFVDGESLAAHVRAHGGLGAKAVALYLRDVASALAHAHKRGIIHRDIKAENILIERATDRALVTDFGIARLAEAAPLTATGQLLGTVYYVSPEQIAGEAIDARSDLYSLGVVGYFALTGQFPFDGELASAVLVAHVTKSPPPVASINPNIPPALAAIVDRCLSKRAADRFANADELLMAIEAAIPQLDKVPVASQPSFSETKAQAVWARAAELQALTGQAPRMAIDELRSVANEAGIGDKYVDRALAEQRDAAPKHAPIGRSLVAGVPLDVVREKSAQGELASRDFERLLNMLRDETGRMGTTLARTREIAWQCGGTGHYITASIVPDRGQTTIRLTRSVRRMVVGSSVVALVASGALGLTVSVFAHRIMHLPGPGWGLRPTHDAIMMLSFGAGILASVTVFPLWRKAVASLWRGRVADMDALADRLAAKVRRLIDEEKR
jgi:serine/threonine-protein kinase